MLGSLNLQRSGCRRVNSETHSEMAICVHESLQLPMSMNVGRYEIRVADARVIFSCS